jgi:hypothetical protein
MACCGALPRELFELIYVFFGCLDKIFVIASQFPLIQIVLVNPADKDLDIDCTLRRATQQGTIVIHKPGT